MKADVTPEGVNVPKSLLDGVDTVEIRREGGHILIIPLNGAPIVNLNELEGDAENSASLQELLDNNATKETKTPSKTTETTASDEVTEPTKTPH